MTIEEVYQYIEVTPLNGGPSVFWGTPITPEHIIDDFAKGMSVEITSLKATNSIA